jgi:hypothetical protein
MSISRYACITILSGSAGLVWLVIRSKTDCPDPARTLTPVATRLTTPQARDSDSDETGPAPLLPTTIDGRPYDAIALMAARGLELTEIFEIEDRAEPFASNREIELKTTLTAALNSFGLSWVVRDVKCKRASCRLSFDGDSLDIRSSRLFSMLLVADFRLPMRRDDGVDYIVIYSPELVSDAGFRSQFEYKLARARAFVESEEQ